MKFSTKQPHTYGGIVLHARTMYVCILNQAGEILLHQQMKASPDPWLRTMAPSRDAIVVAVECLVMWYWLAALCAQAGLPFVLGPALYPESHPWRPSATRPNRGPANRGAPAWGPAPAGLRLSRSHAGDPRSPPAPEAR